MQLHRGCLQNINSQEPNHNSPNQQGEASSSLTHCVMWRDEGQSFSGSREHQFNPQHSKARLCLALTAPQADDPQLCGATGFCSGWSYWLFISKSLWIPCCTCLRAKTSVLELQPQHKPLQYHTLVTCCVCAKGVEINGAVPMLMVLGKFL